MSPPTSRCTPAVLAEAASRVGLQPPIFLHPLVTRIDRDRDGTILPMHEFLVFDTLLMPAVVRKHPKLYRLCKVDRTGACTTPDGAPSVVLSRILDLGRNGSLVMVMISDPRSAEDAQRFYTARVKSGRRGASVVSFERIE